MRVKRLRERGQEHNRIKDVRISKEDDVPKLKSSRGAVKRFKVTASGKIKRRRGYKSHLLSGKGRKRKRRLGQATLVTPGEARNIHKLLPYL